MLQPHYVLSTIIITDISGFYCAQPGHCKQGMVFAINPPTTGDKTFAAFQSLAMGTSTVTYTTATTDTTVVVPPTAAAAAPPAVVSGYNIGDNAQCQCVCNIDQTNGYSPFSV